MTKPDALLKYLVNKKNKWMKTQYPFYGTKFQFKIVDVGYADTSKIIDSEFDREVIIHVQLRAEKTLMKTCENYTFLGICIEKTMASLESKYFDIDFRYQRYVAVIHKKNGTLLYPESKEQLIQWGYAENFNYL
jgi:hypothetical protein